MASALRPKRLPDAGGRVIPAGVARHPDGLARRDLDARDAGAKAGPAQGERAEQRENDRPHAFTMAG